MPPEGPPDEDSDYDEDEEEIQARKNRPYESPYDGMEVAGLADFLKRAEKLISDVLDSNQTKQILTGYSFTDQQDVAETEILHKLANPYDFVEANKEIQKNIMK